MSDAIDHIDLAEDPLERLGQLAIAHNHIESLIAQAVHDCREANVKPISWERIGGILGLASTTAWRRYGLGSSD